MSLSVQDYANLASSAVSQALVRKYGDPYQTGISGLILDLIDDVEVILDADVTDHYVEQNYAIQDHVALKPLRITIRAYSAEVINTYLPSGVASIFTSALSFASFAGVSPTFTTQAIQVYNEANQLAQLVNNVANTAQNIYSMFNNLSTTTTKQQANFKQLYGMWSTRQLCDVETPYNIYHSMIIESIRAVQPGASTLITEFTITFKQIFTVQSITSSNPKGSTASQNTGSQSPDFSPLAAPVQGGGAIQGSTSPGNLLTSSPSALADSPSQLGTVGSGNQGAPNFGSLTI